MLCVSTAAKKVEGRHITWHQAASNLLVVQLPLELLVVPNLSCCLHVVLFDRVVALCADRKHPSLSADIAHVCAIESVSELHYCLPIDIAVLRDRIRMDLQDFQPCLLVRERNFDLS